MVDCGTLQAAKERSLRTSNRQVRQVAMIDQALQRIEQGSYGYCDMTGEPVGLKCLLAMPLATLCVKAQELLDRQRPDGAEQQHLIFSG